MLLVRAVGGRELVARACEQCRTAGVRAGMTVAHARALLPQGRVDVREARFEEDERALEALARWALRFAPVVAPDPPDGLLVDVTGCDRLYGDDEAILRVLVRHVEALGVRVRAACAGTVGCAWAVARYDTRETRRWRVVPPGGERTALAHLPVAALRLDDETVDALDDVSVSSIGQLLELPRNELAARYGGGRRRSRGGARSPRRAGDPPLSSDLLHRLDQALGRAVEPLAAVDEDAPPTREVVFPGPTRHPEGIRRAVGELVAGLADELDRRRAGAVHLRLEAERPAGHAASEDEDADAGGTDRIDLRLARPARDPVHLERLLRPHVERLPLDTGIDRLVLSAPRTGPLRPRPGALPGTTGRTDPANDGHDEDDAFSGAVGDAHWGELVDALVARLGEDRVLGLVARPTLVPESRYRPVRLDEMPFRVRTPDDRDPAAPDDFVPDRPSRLFRPPEPIEVVAGLPPGVPPRRFRHRAQVFDVVRALGPERLGAPWWRLPGTPQEVATLPVRDYFRVLDDHGRWLWIYRKVDRGRDDPRTDDGDRPPLRSRWFLHGEWA